jgi:hypothetical protein
MTTPESKAYLIVPPEPAPMLEEESCGSVRGEVESRSVGELGIDVPVGGTVVVSGLVGGLVKDGSVGGTVANVSVGEVEEWNDDETGGEVMVGLCVEVDTGRNASNTVRKQPKSIPRQLSASTWNISDSVEHTMQSLHASLGAVANVMLSATAQVESPIAAATQIVV